MIAAVIIALVAITLVGIRPKGIPEWVWVLAGAALLLVLGLESFGAAVSSVAAQWNVLLFILGLMGISAAAENSGVFEWIADIMLAKAHGSRRRLFVWTFMLGAVLTAFLSNDATAIVFTPVVYRAVAKRGIDALPYLYACTFVADSASFVLPFSNPANLLVLPRPDLINFAAHLGPAAIFAVIINLVVFLLIFRTRLRGRYEMIAPSPLQPRTRNTLVALAVISVGYVGALLAGLPLGPVALTGALIVLAVSGTTPREASGRIGWSTFLLLAGLFVLIRAIERAGIVDRIVLALHQSAGHGLLLADLTASFGAAVAANLFNNLPVAAMSGTVVAHAGSALIAYPLIAGIDLGPNLTTSGSLATILWLSVVRARGVQVSPLEYLRLGLAVVPAMLVATSLWLWIVR